jgi:hypothetical protein
MKSQKGISYKIFNKYVQLFMYQPHFQVNIILLDFLFKLYWLVTVGTEVFRFLWMQGMRHF